MPENYFYNYNDGFVTQGWQCPVCKRVYSPTTPMCYSCGNEKIETSTTLTVNTNNFSNEYKTLMDLLLLNKETTGGK